MVATKVLANYQILMSGHEHQGGVNLVADTHNHCCVMLEAPALDATKSNAFSVTHLDLQDMTLATEVFKWEDNYYAHEAGMPSWDNKQPIAKIGPRNGFHFTEETKAMLESMEASFQHPTKENLCLSDVFVYPEIQDFDSEEENPKEVSASTLLADVEKNRKVLIYGEEQFGKTSLLKRLCIELQLAGKMPIMIEAADASGSSEQFRKILNRRIQTEAQQGLMRADRCRQYGTAQSCLFPANSLRSALAEQPPLSNDNNTQPQNKKRDPKVPNEHGRRDCPAATYAEVFSAPWQMRRRGRSGRGCIVPRRLRLRWRRGRSCR